jgi:hypothetical protein
MPSLNLTLEESMKPLEGVISSAIDAPMAALFRYVDYMMLIKNPN